MNRIIGQNWEEVAAERVKAGESFKTVANDYGLISQSDLQEANQSLQEWEAAHHARIEEILKAKGFQD